jgi:hypothetical protein
VLAAVTAVNNTNVGADGSPQALLDGFHPGDRGLLLTALLGAAATVVSVRPRRGPTPEPAYAEDVGRE